MMLRHFRLLPQAEGELQAARKYYDTRVAGLGLRFADRVEEAIVYALERPDAGSPFTHRRVSRTVRRYPVKRFPFDVVVTVEADALIVLAISDQRRRPGYWVRRLRAL